MSTLFQGRDNAASTLGPCTPSLCGGKDVLTNMSGVAYEAFGHLLRSLRAAVTPHGRGRAVGWRQLPKGALRSQTVAKYMKSYHFCQKSR